MKFHHRFLLVSPVSSSLLFQSEKTYVRLDFFSFGYRFATYENESDLFPTFSICPDGYALPFEGRNKLSVEGLGTIVPSLKEEEEEYLLAWGEYSLRIEKNNFRIHSFYKGKELVSDREAYSYNFDQEEGEGSCHYLTREKDEKIFGLGDKTGDVNKARRHFLLSTSDAMGFDARSSDPLYKHVPFYICHNSKGTYGLYYDTYSQGSFDFGSYINNYYGPFSSFHCQEKTLVYYFFYGENEKEVLHRFCELRGQDAFPQEWMLRYCGSTMAYTDAPDADKQLRNYVELCRKYDIHPGGFYLSSGYTQIGDKRYVFHWNKDKIPSPEGLAAYFKESGIEFLPNIKPALLSDHPLYEELAKKGYFLHYKDGTPALFPFWGGEGSYLDFTNPEAAAFWTECVKTQLVEKGYLNTWNDNNEVDINDPEVYAHGFGKPIQAILIRPLFSFLMTRASLEGQKDDVRKVAVSRSGIVGTSRLASTWTGDNNTSFEDFRYNHKMAMTMSLSGIFNFGQDVGGFAGPKPSEELFLRWIQYGIFTPRLVLHSWNDDGSSTMPWLYLEHIETVKRLFALRENLLPYFYACLYASVKHKEPIISPLFLTHPGYDVESDQFYYGDSILVAPIFDKGKNQVTLTLPENNGGWYYFGKPVGGKVTVLCSTEDLTPHFIKGGSVIGRKEENETVFEIYPLEKGEFSCEYYLDDGKALYEERNVVSIRVTCEENKVIVTSSIPLPFRLIDKEKRVLVVK